ncbi:MAG: glycosyltransferase family 39 protein [Elusimicrobia bacterium]|nr:glycosyltransferase family 39 protein [Elusimicrobiota bacterium]
MSAARRRFDPGLLAVLALGLAAGLCGIRSGLPGPERWRALPPALRGSSEFAERLAESWRRLYEEIQRAHREVLPAEPATYVRGLVMVPPGWSFPPDPLINSARSLMTQSENPDEKKTFIILSRMRPWKLEFEPLYVQYGGSFVYPFGAFLGAAHALRLARLTPNLAHYLVHPEDMGRLYLLGRVFILIFHLGTLWGLYALGRRLGGARAGLAAALLFAVAPFVATGSHVLKPHPVSAFWFVLAALLAVRGADEDSDRDLLLSGVAAGMAVGASLTLPFVALLPPLMRLCTGRGSWRAALGGGAVAAAVAAAANPYLIFAPRLFAFEMAFNTPRFAVAPAAIAHMLKHALPRGVGLGSTLLIAAGLAWGAAGCDRRARAVSWTALIAIALLWLRFSYLAGEMMLRIFYAPFALSCAVAGALIARWPRAAAAAALALALAESGGRASAYLVNMSMGRGPASTRERAADWIDSHIPAGASVGLLRFPEPPHTPPFQWNRLDLRVFDKAEALNGAYPEWIVASNVAWSDASPLLHERYETAADFKPAAALGRTPTDSDFYLNAGFLVLRRSGYR